MRRSDPGALLRDRPDVPVARPRGSAGRPVTDLVVGCIARPAPEAWASSHVGGYAAEQGVDVRAQGRTRGTSLVDVPGAEGADVDRREQRNSRRRP